MFWRLPWPFTFKSLKYFKIKKVVRSFNVQREWFWERGLWLFQLRDSSGAKSLWRSAEIVRLEIPWKVDGYCAFQKRVNSEVQKPQAFTIIVFFAAVNHKTITKNESWNTKTHKRHRNPPIKNHKPWPFEPFKVNICFRRGLLRWLTAVKNANVTWLLNFRICVFLKSAVTLHCIFESWW